MITQAYLRDDARLPSSKHDDYVFLIGLSAICLYTVVTQLVLFDADKLLLCARGDRTTDRNSRKLDFRWLVGRLAAGPCESQKLHYYPTVTRLSAVVMRADVSPLQRPHGLR